jgi:hypothetical protein
MRIHDHPCTDHDHSGTDHDHSGTDHSGTDHDDTDHDDTPPRTLLRPKSPCSDVHWDLRVYSVDDRVLRHNYRRT